MSEHTDRIRALAAKVADLPFQTGPEVSLVGVLAGALYSLEKADQNGYKDARGQSQDVQVFADEFRRTLKKVGKGEQPPLTWVGGYYFTSALVRLAALVDRLDLPLTARSRSHLVHDVDWFKHRSDAHPVSRIVTTWDEVLRVSSAVCDHLEDQ